jgi:hypothetical protein
VAKCEGPEFKPPVQKKKIVNDCTFSVLSPKVKIITKKELKVDSTLVNVKNLQSVSQS